MKKTLIVLAASLSMGMMGSAFAQSATQSTAPAASAAHREARTEARIRYLHSALKITPQQEPQWSAFADVMRGNGDTMSQLYRQRMAEKNLSALDDVKSYAQISQANADGAQKLVNAFEPLYNSFSPAQKAIADKTFSERHQAIARKLHRHHNGKAKGAAAASGAAAQ